MKPPAKTIGISYELTTKKANTLRQSSTV